MAKPLTAEQAIFLLQECVDPMLKARPHDKAVARSSAHGQAGLSAGSQRENGHGLVRHIAAAENDFWKPPSREFNTSTGAIPENVKTPAEIAGWYAERFEKNFDALNKLSGEQLVKMVDFRGMFAGRP